MIYKNVELYNVEEIREDNDGLQLLRIPETLRSKLNDNAKNASLYPSGCEIRFNLKSEICKIVLKGINGNGICEVFFGDFFESWRLIKGEPTEIEIRYPQNIEYLSKLSKEKNLKFDPKLVRVILPHLLITKIVDIGGEFELPRKNQTPKVKYLAYGSSITHGATSLRPTGTYASKIAQILNVDLINLGFGGGAHLEKEIADYIAERDDWDFGTFELGINMVGGFEVDEFEKRVDYFIEKIVDKKPDKYLFFIDIFPFYMDFDNQEKQEKFREIVKNKVKEVNKDNVIHISGFDILKSLKGLTFDILHPSPFGMEEMAYNLANIMKSYGLVD
ncbi:MAG TPA: SGNH/GDSL hydrolase family protein [bacterium]|nr:SGNH/GDSL hydrolase family protein [bacterium]HOM26901.1 SGNH/GDSL hydrolase family protein [bacterium]